MESTRKQEELQKLHKGICRCRKCPLHQNRIHAVPGEGPVWSDILFIGEAPGKNEDEQGRPFVGRSGKILDLLLDKINMSREEVYITSTVKCRPPNNRTPLAKELGICKNNWLDRQISLIDPKIVVLLGKVSTNQMLEEKQKLSSLHGRTFRKNDRIYLATYNPAAAMRFPHIRNKILKDISELSELLK
jgi:uracil-DNA glycosylase family 4